MATIVNARARVEVTRARANLNIQFCLHPYGCGQFFNSKKYVFISEIYIKQTLFIIYHKKENKTRGSILR